MTGTGPDPDMAQRAAADPRLSAWVSASAGTGKTTVLIKRVLSLLLTGTRPDRILCITYTKAAAAEMANRLARELAQWAVAADRDLEDKLGALMDRPPDAELMGRARRLFARVLEVPGGMHIQTIHAFCQGILRRFPIEAGVSPHFRTLEEQDSRELLREARERVLLRARRPDDPLAGPLVTVTQRVNADAFDSLLGELAANRARLSHSLAAHGGLEPAITALGRGLGIAPRDDEDAIIALACDEEAFDGTALRGAVRALEQGTDAEGKRAALLANWLAAPAAARAEGFDLWVKLFLTDLDTRDGPRLKADRSLASKAAQAADPACLQALHEEGARLIRVLDRLRALRTHEATVSLLRLAAAMLADYEARKRVRALMDFDDLIQHTRALLTADRVPWVLYKLDNGLDHVLVDEAQDSNADQWRVVQSLVDDFFSGEGAHPDIRTLFAVGDFKQSIYSFQGAEPGQFLHYRDIFEHQVRNGGGKWKNQDLATSFRSTRNVLHAVDLVFNGGEAGRGVIADGKPLHHKANREDDPGSVEIWPLIPKPDYPEPQPWNPPVELINPTSAQTLMAERLARRLARMTGADGGPGEWLAAQKRPVRPRDVMVLVRRRGGFVDDLVRQLKRFDVPVAGADRLVLIDHLAVRDLIALGRFVLLPQDDLTLAVVLKGPIVDLEEEELFALAHDRGEASLWQALTARAGENDAFARAHELLGTLLARADRMPPFEFFSRILSGDGGRRRILTRLGMEAEDPLEEFLSLALAYERGHPPSMEGFLHWLEQGQAEIKRDLDQSPEDAVRIMTVHGSKGLEAPVVFLPDCSGKPRGGSSLFWVDDPADPERDLLLWPPRAADREELGRAAARAEDGAREEEYHRLLYVAMTRAKDHLIICGWERRGAQDDWYDLITRALTPHCATVADPLAGDTDTETILLLGAGLELAPAAGELPAAAEESPAAAGEATVPDWLHRPPPAEPDPPRPLAPSRQEADPAALSPVADGGVDRFRRGLLIHRLLQYLPDMDAGRRRRVAEDWLSRCAADLDAEQRSRLSDETLAILENPDLEQLFGPGSRAEVPLAGRIGRHVVSGQIDRLVVLPDRVLVVDYKTNRPPPALVSEVPHAYMAQMAAYRALLREIHGDRPVVCHLLWTDGPRLMTLPDALLDRAAP